MCIRDSIGISFTGTIPTPDFFTQQTDWTWFLTSPEAAISQGSALQSIYQNARIVSLGGAAISH